MFWHSETLEEEEWSLSAKLIGGLVLNPLALTNTTGVRLVDWFLERVLGSTYRPVHAWSAQPEYSPRRKRDYPRGRNDWAVEFPGTIVLVECKFGDGIDPETDCFKYLDAHPPGRAWLAIIASVSELAKLTQEATQTTPDFERLRTELKAGRVALFGWHEVVDAAKTCLAQHPDLAALLDTWASGVSRKGAVLVPPKLLAGHEAAELIIEGRSSSLRPTHRPDPWSNRRATSDLDTICDKTGAPEWVRIWLWRIKRECESRRIILEEMDEGWVDLRRKNGGYTLVLPPWGSGIASLVTHPKPNRHYSNWFVPAVRLSVPLPPNRQHFPPDRVIGMEVTESDDVRLADLQEEVFRVIKLL